MKKINIIIYIIIILIGSIFLYLDIKNMKKTNLNNKKIKPEYDGTYNIDLIKRVNATQEENYLISPYSIEMALNMLKDGANGQTKEQIEKVVGTREIPVFNVKDRISVTNGAFIKEEYKDYIEESYYEKLKKYDAELIFDKFDSPDKINNWVKEKTYGMIPKILNEISKDFVLGLGNAVAIDVEWDDAFDCSATSKEKFTKENNKKIDVEMMHQKFENGDVRYFETDDSKGVIIPYRSYDKNGLNKYESKENEFTELEFIGILPNKDVDTYINNLNQAKIDRIDMKNVGTDDFSISVSLPRFKYDFDLEDFMDVLKEMGIKDVFDDDKSDLTNIISQENIYKMNATRLYVSTAIHKTHIDLNEKGTKAAAITYFGIEKATAMLDEKENKSIEFNKPFVYMIRDKETKEILFFGVVKEPNIWKGSTCE